MGGIVLGTRIDESEVEVHAFSGTARSKFVGSIPRILDDHRQQAAVSLLRTAAKDIAVQDPNGPISTAAIRKLLVAAQAAGRSRALTAVKR